MNDEELAAALALVRQHLGDTAAKQLALKLEDADRIAVIRDAFLEGRDRDAVTLMRDLAQWGSLHEGSFRFLPMSTGVLIEPNKSAQITARPQAYAFSALALLVSEQSRRFLISDIRVGMRSQFVQSGDIPADVLTPIPAALEFIANPSRGNGDEAEGEADAEARGPEIVLRADVLSRAIVPIDCDVCLTAQDLSIIVVNPTDTPLPWRAVWLGKDVQRPAARSPGDPRTDRADNDFF